MKTPARTPPRIRPTVASSPRPARAVRIIETRIIKTESDIVVGIKALRRKCDVIRRIHDQAGDPPLRRRPPGLDGLARIIVGQQVSVASANAIWARFEAVAGDMTAARLASMSDEDFRAGGLSRPKIATLRAVAETINAGRIDLEGLAHDPVDDAHAALTSVRGIGPWTADVYLMFCAGHTDVFASGDLALQEAARMAFDLDERPTRDALAALAAKRWQPWRAVAARMLWHYYAWAKAPGSGQPV